MEALKLGEMRTRKTKDGQNVLEQDIDGTEFVVVTNFGTGVSESSFGREWHRGRCMSRLKSRENGKVVVDWNSFEKIIEYFNK